MSGVLISYPELTDELFVASGFSSGKPSLEYDDEYEKYPLELTENDLMRSGNKYLVKDSRCVWDADTHNMRVAIDCGFTTAFNLFGDGGIAKKSSIIGVAVRWQSPDSGERGLRDIGRLCSKDGTKRFHYDEQFEKGHLKGTVRFEFILYLLSSAESSDNDIYADTPGTVLGILDRYELIIDGNGSLFPIVYNNDPKKPLYEVYYNEYADIFSDKFDSENVEIRINQAHPGYELIKNENNIIEIMASAMFVIVQAVKDAAGEEWDRVISEESPESGSIAEAIQYFAQKLEWDVSTPARLSGSINSYFERIRGQIQ